jgi:hypothetical protein
MPKAAKLTKVDVNGSAGAFVSIACSIWCRHMEIVETDDGTAGFAFQGLQYQLEDDNYATTYYAAPGEAIVRGNSIAESDGRGSGVGKPAQTDHYGNTHAATIPVKIKSLTATTTKVLVKELS